jgi:4-amino-4-deoxy-L-arabinose transferase-like glycosyltransferase
MLLLTLALGWVVFLIARRLGGDWGGLLSVAVYATTPVFLVFGPLVLTDVAITFLLAVGALGAGRAVGRSQP